MNTRATTAFCCAIAAAHLLCAGAFASHVTAIDIGFVSDNIITFDTSSPTTHTIIGTTTRPIFGMDYSTDGSTLWAVDHATRELLTINDTTGVITPVVTLTGVPAADTITGITIDPTDETMYLSSTDGAISRLFTVNTVTGVTSLVGSMLPSVNIDISINCLGQMYGHDIVTDSLYTIDKTNGTSALIGLTGFAASFAQGMDFDHSDGTLFATLYLGGGDNRWVSFDLGSGAATELASFLGEFEMAVRGPCLDPAAIPTVSEWGLIVLALLMLTAGTIIIRSEMARPVAA